VLGLVIVDYQAGVNYAGNPAKQRQQKAQEKTEYPAGHQDGDRRKNNAEKVAESFHFNN
jgi:hypothetical protein